MGSYFHAGWHLTGPGLGKKNMNLKNGTFDNDFPGHRYYKYLFKEKTTDKWKSC